MLNTFLEEIGNLQKRSELLDDILKYYNKETMEFDIPKKWNTKIRKDKLPAESPRHLLKKKIVDKLPVNDLHNLGIYDYSSKY